MFINAIRLNLRNPQARDDARDCRKLHGTLETAVTGQPTTPRMLWAQPARDLVLVRSNAPITEQCFPLNYTHAVKSRPAPELPATGDLVKIAGIIHGRNWGKLRPEADCVEWIRERVTAFIDTDPTIERLPKAQGVMEDGKRVGFRRFAVAAIGHVTDAGLLHDALVNGLGGRRAYGMGLLVASASEVGR